jgi:hypothetical protein
VVVITPGWADVVDERGRRRLDNPEDFVRIEIETALRRDTWVIPVLVGGAVMPASDELPEKLRPLARRQAHEIRDASWDYNVDQLVSSMERRGLRPIHPAKTPTHEPRQAAERAKSRKAPIVAVGMVGMIAVAVLVFANVRLQPGVHGADRRGIERRVADSDVDPPIDVGNRTTADPSAGETSSPPVKTSSEPVKDASLDAGAGKATPDAKSDAVRSAIEETLDRAARAEIAALRDMDVEPLYRVYGGSALEDLEGTLAELSSVGFHGVATLHGREIRAIQISPDGSDAEVEMIEAWSMELHNEAMGACLLVPRHDAHQTVHLYRRAGAWKIEEAEHYSMTPDPIPC